VWRLALAVVALAALIACRPIRVETEPPEGIDASSEVAARAAGDSARRDTRQPGRIDAAPSTRYSFRVDAALESLQGRVCISGYDATELEPPIPDARSYGSVENRDANGCFLYTVDLAAAEEAWYGLASPHRLRDALVVSPDFWLWVPLGKPDRGAVTARFELPPDLDAAVPWPRGLDGAYHVPASQFELASQAVFGKLERRPLRVAGAVFDVVTLGGAWKDLESGVFAWLRRAAEAQRQLFGAFPVERAWILMVRDARRKNIFGYALRGGGSTVVLLMPETPTARMLSEDWVAVHELTHLGVPEMPRRDAWLYEGLATYYTYVLRARAGMISEERAWAHLFDGFERGRGSTTGDTLERDSERMRKTHAYWRVYWAGAAFALAADLELRKRGRSLDAALGELVRCCLSNGEHAAADLLTRLDAWLGAALFVPLAAEHLGRTGFPDTRNFARFLGVRPSSADACHFDDSADGAALRRSITGRSPSGNSTPAEAGGNPASSR
jgi:hypothetical protein